MRTPEESKHHAEKRYQTALASIPEDIQQKMEMLPATLRALNAKGTTKLARLYDLVEEVFGYVGSHVACRKGCSYCCHVSVQVSRLEAQYIAEKTGHKPVILAAPVYRDPYAFSQTTPCPFLRNNTCSIYPVRPLACRTQVNLDIDEYWCKFENWHKPGAASHKPTFHPIVTAYRELMTQHGGVPADIRDFFPHGNGLQDQS